MQRKTFLLLSAGVMGLAAGQAGFAADVPNFNQMDKNDDGMLTRAEASANPRLAEHFAKVDENGDGKLTRGEYLAVMARRDLYFVRENLAEFVNPDDKAPLATDQQVTKEDIPNFNQLDKDGDGNLTRSEAGGNPRLAQNFQKADEDGDGNVTRSEYLAVMGQRDVHVARDKLADFIKPEGQPPLAMQQEQGRQGGKQQAGRQQASAGATADRSGPPPAVTADLVRKVQQSLEDKGVNPGPVDGIWGPKTSAAVRNFQQEQGLNASGQLNAQTLSALGIAEGSQSAAGGTAPRAQKQETSAQQRQSGQNR